MRIEAVVTAGEGEPGLVSVVLELEAPSDARIELVESVVLTIRPRLGVELRSVGDGLPVEHRGARQVVIELGELRHAEWRAVPMDFSVPAGETDGPTRIASLELHYVEVPSGIRHLAMLPLVAGGGPA